MIVTLKGTITDLAPLSATIEANGIGYEVHIPLTTAERMPRQGAQVKLYTQTIYREDSQTIYGFIEREDRDFFRLLIQKVSGIGPRIGLTAMSKMSVSLLKNAIAAGDAGLLAKCPGIGKKTAERIILDLKDKVGLPSVTAPIDSSNSNSSTESDASPMNQQQDAIEALMALGYKPADADKAVRRAINSGVDANSTEAIIKASFS